MDMKDTNNLNNCGDEPSEVTKLNGYQGHGTENLTADDDVGSESEFNDGSIPLVHTPDDINDIFKIHDFSPSHGLGEESADKQLANPVMNLSFAGCGFLGVYHLGVAVTLARHGPRLLKEVQRFAGASAGALVASALVVTSADINKLEECVQFVFDLAAKINKKPLGIMTPGVSLLEPLCGFLEKMMPEDAHLIASGRLYISLTEKDTKQNLLVSEYNSREELIQCLMGTSYIPFVTGSKAVVFKGKKYLDGGMTDNLPIFKDGRTIQISPFCGRQDIHPSDKSGPDFYVSILQQDFKISARNIVRGYHALAPPKTKQLKAYFERGMSDTVKFLKSEGLYDDIVNYETTV